MFCLAASLSSWASTWWVVQALRFYGISLAQPTTGGEGQISTPSSTRVLWPAPAADGFDARGVT